MLEQFMVGGLMYEVAVRLLVAALLGIIMGTERSLAHKTAGMRTYSLISMSAALFVILGALTAERIGSSSGTLLNLMGQIVTGIGFIGTGVIIFHNEKIVGLTTAAGLWVAAGVGMASGLGLYLIAALAALMGLVILSAISRLENKIVATHDGDPKNTQE